MSNASPITKALTTARRKLLSEVEEAHHGTQLLDFSRPISSRNEAAALAWLLENKDLVCHRDASLETELERLCAEYCTRLGVESVNGQCQPLGRSLQFQLGQSSSSQRQDLPVDSPVLEFARRCSAGGVTSLASPAMFGGRGLRGLAADADLSAGQVAISVPTSHLISFDTAMDSDFGKCLQHIPGLGREMAVLVWTMVERQDTDSEWAAYWNILPRDFGTGLSVGEGILTESLAGTALLGEALGARQHLLEQYQGARPALDALLEAYPKYLQPEMFGFAEYLWACELWYAYAIQVQQSDGSVSPCLVPYVGLLNHSPYPHSVHFSKVDPDSQELRVRTFRPCAAGEELTLSYGPLPNAKLLLFYGFAVEHNPHDAVSLSLQVPGAPPPSSQQQAALLSADLSLECTVRHSVASTSDSGAGSDSTGPGWSVSAAFLPEPLVSCQRLLSASPSELEGLRACSTPLRSALQVMRSDCSQCDP
ncbi:MAG: hypothetical protein WDW36_003841 [Sanguina aurantia]